MGVVLGMAIGSFLALLVSGNILEGAQRVLHSLSGGDDRVNFELLQQ